MNGSLKRNYNMTVNITKHAHISYISINETEKKDIEKGVLDILNYVDILKNVIILVKITYYSFVKFKILNWEKFNNLIILKLYYIIRLFFLVN